MDETKHQGTFPEESKQEDLPHDHSPSNIIVSNQDNADDTLSLTSSSEERLDEEDQENLNEDNPSPLQSDEESKEEEEACSARNQLTTI